METNIQNSFENLNIPKCTVCVHQRNNLYTGSLVKLNKVSFKFFINIPGWL